VLTAFRRLVQSKTQQVAFPLVPSWSVWSDPTACALYRWLPEPAGLGLFRRLLHASGCLRRAQVVSLDVVLGLSGYFWQGQHTVEAGLDWAGSAVHHRLALKAGCGVELHEWRQREYRGEEGSAYLPSDRGRGSHEACPNADN